MSDCVCHVALEWGHRSRNAYATGPHHGHCCPNYVPPSFDATRIPADAQQLFDNARSASDERAAILNDDLCREHCD